MIVEERVKLCNVEYWKLICLKMKSCKDTNNDWRQQSFKTAIKLDTMKLIPQPVNVRNSCCDAVCIFVDFEVEMWQKYNGGPYCLPARWKGFVSSLILLLMPLLHCVQLAHGYCSMKPYPSSNNVESRAREDSWRSTHALHRGTCASSVSNESQYHRNVESIIWFL